MSMGWGPKGFQGSIGPYLDHFGTFEFLMISSSKLVANEPRSTNFDRKIFLTGPYVHEVGL